MVMLLILCLLAAHTCFGLPSHIIEHETAGYYIKDHEEHDIFVREYPCTSFPPTSCPTLLFLHGFPTSSYDFTKVASSFTTTHNVVTYDHLGFGLSDKPNRKYFLRDHALNLDQVIRTIAGDKVDFVAHDMGDKVLTEYLRLRYEEGESEVSISKTLGTIVFTNGGMVNELVNMRWGQIMITSIFANKIMELCPKLMRHWFTRMQLASIWGGSWSVMLSSWFGQDIEDMMTLLEHKGGGEIIHKLGNYMKELDRKGDYGREKEPWVAAVVKAAANEGVVVWFVWGDGDTMAPKEIAQAFTDKVEVDLFGTHAQEGHCSPKHLILLEGCGHFGMLEQPEKYTEEVKKALGVE